VELEALSEARPVEEAPPTAEAPDPEDAEELLLLAALVVPLADTISPTWPERETIVPSSGA
jgi:hypothetical protein